MKRSRRAHGGSLPAGCAGALLGALPGAALSALALFKGYVSVLCGLLIGCLANALYGRFGGRRGAARLLIVLLALLVGVSLGQVGGYTLLFAGEYAAVSEEATIGRGEFVRRCWERYLLFDQETALGLAYDRELAGLEPSQRTAAMDREEYIRLRYSDGVDGARIALRRRFAGVYLLSLMLGLIGSAGVFVRLSRTEPRRVRLLK